MKPERVEQLKTLGELSSRLHDGKDAADVYTFRSLREHVEEVRMLQAKGDEHWKAETADIIIHALMLLERRGVESEAVEDLIDKRLFRFKEKISGALSERERKERFRKNIYAKEDSGH